MKGTLVLVIVLGLVAAISAAFLVQRFAAPPKQAATAAAEVEVLVATRDLPAAKVVESDAVTVKKVARNAAPAKALKDPVQVVGQVLIVPVVKGEAFTEMNFARDGAVKLPAALPNGKRAITLSLSDSGGMMGLLYPGAVVDVLVSVQVSRGGSQGESITRTLVQGVQVLAVGKESIASERSTPAKAGTALSGEGDQRLVTLLVDQAHAQALQLASQRGTVTLAMRNPLDQEKLTLKTTRLADLAGIAGSEEKSAATAVASALMENLFTNLKAARTWTPPAAPPATQPAEKAAPAPAWEVMIVNGPKFEVKTFPAVGQKNGTTVAEGPKK